MHDVSFFFNDTATTEIYTLSLHDALPIYGPRIHRHRIICAERHGHGDREGAPARAGGGGRARLPAELRGALAEEDRKSTRLNSSHANISYAVFCLKKKKQHSEYY